MNQSYHIRILWMDESELSHSSWMATPHTNARWILYFAARTILCIEIKSPNQSNQSIILIVRSKFLEITWQANDSSESEHMFHCSNAVGYVWKSFCFHYAGVEGNPELPHWRWMVDCSLVWIENSLCCFQLFVEARMYRYVCMMTWCWLTRYFACVGIHFGCWLLVFTKYGSLRVRWWGLRRV